MLTLPSRESHQSVTAMPSLRREASSRRVSCAWGVTVVMPTGPRMAALYSRALRLRVSRLPYPSAELRGAIPSTPTCRLCGAALELTFVDLGASPLCESFLSADELDRMEPFYPLHARLCSECLLVQLDVFVDEREIFGGDYAYFSAFSDSWVEHARVYAKAMTHRLGLTGESLVLELASNDGYLLQHFVRAGIPSLGVDPARNVAEAARERGVETLVAF